MNTTSMHSKYATETLKTFKRKFEFRSFDCFVSTCYAFIIQRSECKSYYTLYRRLSAFKHVALFSHRDLDTLMNIADKLDD